MRCRIPLVLLALAAAAGAQAPARRAVVAGDIYRLRDVGSPVISPDGQWVAFTVTTSDSAKDKKNADLYMTSWDGARTLRLTFTPESESAPQWSPDGRYLSFLSARGDDDKGDQLWLLDRAGGEAEKVTDIKSGVDDYQWSPNGKQLVFVVQDPDPDSAKASEKKTPKPVVIDRWDFKRDYTGYLDHRREHLYLFDLATRKLTQITTGDMDDANPAWSPDGARILFSSKRAPGSDRTDNWDLYVIDARAGATPVQLTTYAGNDNGDGVDRPAWSPDGKWIAYLRKGDPRYWGYTHYRVTVVAASGGEPKLLTDALDRPASDIHWAPDGKAIYFLVADDRSVQLARVAVARGNVDRLTPAGRVVDNVDVMKDRVVVLTGTDSEPSELAVYEKNSLRRLTHQNDSLVATLALTPVREVNSKSMDGTVVGSLLYLPAGYRAGQRYPLALFIHGGPFSENQHEFSLQRQVFAARGYAVIAPNYRGSDGRGEAYSKAIFADWGHKEVIDLLGAVDEMLAQGIADSARLVVGGWSYGGILTDYTIATDRRFKAAVSGAGSAMQLSMYGADEYVYQYETELGTPWKNPDAWMKVSYPFFKADKITTPTLFMGGTRDANVPIIGGEQMYEALKSNGIEAQLVAYPGMFHGPSAPSQRYDIMMRYVNWWDRFVHPVVP